MANVDQCTRYAEAGLADDAEIFAAKISTVPNHLRNLIFRDKTSAEIAAMLRNFSATIKETVSAKFDFACAALFASSDDNRDGADLYALLPSGEKVIIEVKFGSFTDKAAGMDAFAQIFGTQFFSETLSLATRKTWQALVAAEAPNLAPQLARTTAALNSAVEVFNREMSARDFILPPHLQTFMEDYLLNNSGAYKNHSANYIRFEVDKKGTTIHDVMLVKKGFGAWHVRPVSPLNPADEKSRINVFAYNPATNLEIKFTLNNKNDFKFKSGLKIRSKFMLNSPSWNVWIRPLKEN